MLLQSSDSQWLSTLAADLHCSLATGCSLFQQIQNIQAAFLGPPDSSPRDADRQGQKALSHVQESLAKLVHFIAALKVRSSKDRPGGGHVEIPAHTQHCYMYMRVHMSNNMFSCHPYGQAVLNDMKGVSGVHALQQQ